MPKYDFCINQANECEAVHPAGEAYIYDWDWQVTGGTVYPYGPQYRNATIYPSSTSMMVELKAYNTCGSTDWKRMYTNVITCRSYYLAISPNPSNSETTISIESGTPEETALKSASPEPAFYETTEWEMEVYSTMQSLKAKQTKIRGNSTKINTQSWKEGVYTVRAKYKDQVLTSKLVVKK